MCNWLGKDGRQAMMAWYVEHFGEFPKHLTEEDKRGWFWRLGVASMAFLAGADYAASKACHEPDPQPVPEGGGLEAGQPGPAFGVSSLSPVDQRLLLNSIRFPIANANSSLGSHPESDGVAEVSQVILDNMKTHFVLSRRDRPKEGELEVGQLGPLAFKWLVVSEEVHSNGSPLFLCLVGPNCAGRYRAFNEGTAFEGSPLGWTTMEFVALSFAREVDANQFISIFNIKKARPEAR